jgi:TerB-C domain
VQVSRNGAQPSLAFRLERRAYLSDGHSYEGINDAAFDRFDSPLLEGEDPIDVNCDLMVNETA